MTNNTKKLLQVALKEVEYDRERLTAYYEATGDKTFDIALHFINMAIEEMERAILQ